MTAIDSLIDLARRYEHRLPEPPAVQPAPVGAAIAGWIDHTLLKPEATAEQVIQLCAEARTHRFASVCVNPVFLPLAVEQLAGSGVPACVVVGFPLGANLLGTKAAEAQQCLEHGAQELDMVLHVGGLKGGSYAAVLDDIRGVVQAAHSRGALVKVIIETCLLTRFEKILACLLSQEAGADFVKTSTGFSSGGATVEDIDLMYRTVGRNLQVKASGGVRTLPAAQALIAVGATRLGSSSGVQIVHEAGG
ncbi:MAG: deoxyribose-phosphate aldolase [Chloroflexota bacterium]